MIPCPGEEDRCVWQEIGAWFKSLVLALLAIVLAGIAASLVALRWMA